MDQQTEEVREREHSKESRDHRKEDKDNSEESMDGRKEEKTSDEAIKEESSDDEGGMAAWSLFAHPCSLLQYMLRACAYCLGLQDSFSDPKPGSAPAPANQLQEGEEDNNTRTEVITQVWALRRRPRPPGNPREGSGGNGGVHN